MYQFYDFSPRIFKLIWELYSISDESYLKAVGPESVIGELMLGNFMCLTEQSSTGKSGSFFYYTADGKFMLKTISHEEFYFL